MYLARQLTAVQVVRQRRGGMFLVAAGRVQAAVATQLRVEGEQFRGSGSGKRRAHV